MRDRWCWRWAALAMLACALPAQAKVLTFGIQPQWSRAQMQRMFAPLMDYLSAETGHDFRLRITEDYGALLDEMQSGVVDVGKFTPYGYVLAKRSQGVRIFATELTHGRPFYYGYIIARKDSGIRGIEDLRARSFCYTDPNSTSGFIYPRALLVERGEDPNTFFDRSVFAGSHDVCIRGVYAGEVDGGATWDVAFEDEASSTFLGVKGDELRVIHKTEPIPNDAYAARPGLEPEIVEAVQRALLKLNGDGEKLRQVIDWRTRIDGFVVGDDTAYEVVREKVALKDLKQRLAILPLDRKGVGFSMDSPGEMAAELLASKLFDTQRFILIERSKLDTVLGEQKLGVQDLFDEGNAVKLGNLVGANVLLTGSVMMLDGRIHVTSRLLDTETGRILSAQHGKGESLDQVLDDVTRQIVSEREARGFILRVTGTQNVSIDIGSTQGVRPGDVLRVYRQGEPLLHPVTGKLLGTEELIVGEIVAVRATPEITFARLVASQEQLQQGFRVRTLARDEMAMSIADPTGVISDYLADERTKYEPWLQKYAWRVAAFGSIPALWAAVDGSGDQFAIYGGLAAALWGVAGISYAYFKATEDDRPVPTYLRGGAR